MTTPLTAEEIRDVNTRYHDVAAGHYDSKWGIDFGEIGRRAGHRQGAQGARGGSNAGPGGRGSDPPSDYPRSLEIGAGTGYFTLNLLRAGLIGRATCTDISPGCSQR